MCVAVKELAGMNTHWYHYIHRVCAIVVLICAVVELMENFPSSLFLHVFSHHFLSHYGDKLVYSYLTRHRLRRCRFATLLGLCWASLGAGEESWISAEPLHLVWGYVVVPTTGRPRSVADARSLSWLFSSVFIQMSTGARWWEKISPSWGLHVTNAHTWCIHPFGSIIAAMLLCMLTNQWRSKAHVALLVL